MKTICLYFEIHQIIHLKRYRCFDIGRDHYYFDDYENERSITDIAERSYIPALTTLIQMAEANKGAFKVALSLSGVGLEQLEMYAPSVIELLHQLNDTGCCEFLCEPYSHGLSSLANEECFREDVERILAPNNGRKALLLERWLKREIFPKLEELESVYSFLAEHLAFMQEIMSVPIEEQPDVIFCLPDLPVCIERRKVKK